jgi:creatinine amidohydrolase/Fe(II)-dependent formamide hydrolase-like protein
MILNGYLKKRKNSPEAEPGASRITSRHREILGLAAHPSLTSRAGWIRNYPRGSYGESRWIRGICVTNWSLSSLGPEGGLVPATNRAAFFVH